MSKGVNIDNDIVYSIPKEDRDNKKDFKPKTFKPFEGKRTGDEARIETKLGFECDSDGFEIISVKKQGEKKKPYKKREYEENGKFQKRENGEERPATAVRKPAFPIEAPKPKLAHNTNLNKVTVLENVKNFFFFLF